jgi:hypothetical protein
LKILAHMKRLNEAELSAIAGRLNAGCPTEGVSVSPWAQQLQLDATALLADVMALRAEIIKRDLAEGNGNADSR